MSEDEMKNIAQEYAQSTVEGVEFLSVAEDPYLAMTPEDELERLHELITTAQVTLSWPED